MKTIKRLVISLFLLVPFAASASNFSEGMGYYSAKNYSKAKEAFQKEVLANSSNGTAYYFLGEIEKNAGNFTDAPQRAANTAQRAACVVASIHHNFNVVSCHLDSLSDFALCQANQRIVHSASSVS